MLLVFSVLRGSQERLPQKARHGSRVARTPYSVRKGAKADATGSAHPAEPASQPGTRWRQSILYKGFPRKPTRI